MRDVLNGACVSSIVSFVSVDQPKLLSAAGCIAIGELAKVCPLPIANESDGDMSKLYIVERLLKYLQEVSDVRVCDHKEYFYCIPTTCTYIHINIYVAIW